MKGDIENRKAIELLVNTFYQNVKADEVIGFIFNDVAKVNWEKHLPVMYNFWENIILFTGSYSGNPMSVHMNLNRLFPLKKVHFERWLTIFNETVDELFEGEKAVLAKQRALSIATMMEIRIRSGLNSGVSLQ